MFRRHWSGLPEDACFPKSLKDLGYFVNDQDEIRSTQNPDNYFKFFINKNMRININQRFGFHSAVETLIHDRLEQSGLCKKTLPLGTPNTKPHIPIFVSPDLMAKSRVIVFFGEPTQELGVLAHRVMEGPGGLDQGSMVSVVHAIKKLQSSVNDAIPPGIILANTGETYWWLEEGRALTVTGSMGIPLPSLAHHGRQYVPILNDVPENKDAAEHVKYIFDAVLKTMIGECAKVDVVAVGASCEIVERYLEIADNWAVWGSRLNAMLLMGTVYPTENLTNVEFKNFLTKRACGYVLSLAPQGTALAPPTGNPNESIPELGCPVYSSSEPHYTELILIRVLDTALAYLQEAAMSPHFENAPIVVVDRPQEELTEEVWANLPKDEKPLLTTVDPEVMKEQVKQARRWKKFAETGQAPDSSEDENEENNTS